MRNIRESGQAFILVLVILAIGASMIIPVLRLTDTGVKADQIISNRNEGLYLAEAAQQKIFWMLYHGGLADSFQNDGDTVNLAVDVCGVPVEATIIMRAVEAVEGIVLATEHTKLPSMQVSDDGVNFYETITVPYADYNTLKNYWFEFNIEQVSSNTTSDVESLWHLIPAGFRDITYVSAQINIDGNGWVDMATYNPSYVPAQLTSRIYQFPGTGTFGADFGQMIPGQVNSIRYKLNAKFQNTGIELCSWTIIKVGDIYTLSGPQATVAVLDNKGDYEAGCNTNGFFDAYKVSEPEIIPPLVSTEVTYTIYIENIKSNTQKIADVVDYLPPGFEYYATIDGITLEDPVISTDNVNGVVRDKLTWSPQYSIAAAETVNMTFIAVATQGVSGSYFNEVLVLPNTVPTMTELDQIDDEYNWELNLGQTYSWNSGTVIVPAFDSETSANGENISTNLALTPEGVIINSWHIK